MEVDSGGGMKIRVPRFVWNEEDLVFHGSQKKKEKLSPKDKPTPKK